MAKRLRSSFELRHSSFPAGATDFFRQRRVVDVDLQDAKCCSWRWIVNQQRAAWLGRVVVVTIRCEMTTGYTPIGCG
jgi:hypothetical protein